MIIEDINGFCHRDFTDVKQFFYENFLFRNEVGASVCVYYDGECVVHLWGGISDAKKKISWSEETKTLVFSTTKGMSALALAVLHAKGLLDYEEKISTYWKEFGTKGKKDITVRQLLSHQAGLCTLNQRLTYDILTDEKKLSSILANVTPRWNPGDYQGYHAWTIGFYIHEIIKSITGKSLQQYFSEEIAQPLGISGSIGLVSENDNLQISRLIPIYPREIIRGHHSGDWLRYATSFTNPFSIWFRTLLNPSFAINLENFNEPRYQRLPIGSTMGFFSAKDLAKIYNECIIKNRIIGLSDDTLSLLESPSIAPLQSRKDLILGEEIPFHLGFAKTSAFQGFGLNHRAYGSFGAGGSGAFVDPERKFSFAYVMNKMGAYLANDPRELALRQAIIACVKKKNLEKKMSNNISNS
jgi:CubicO group peptidase (beta-lactamase class C family)